MLWALKDPARLAGRVADALADPANEVAVSAASGWEIAIKQSIGRLVLPALAADWLPGAVSAVGFRWFPIQLHQVLGVGKLPLHHRDPFDRLLVAQALDLGFTLASSDDRLAAYGVPLLWR